jgi:ADP-ribose diphosphatase
MISPWTVLESRIVSPCRIFDLRQDECVHPTDGRTGSFFILEVPDWVNVMAVTPDEEFVIVRQYRHGTRDFTLEVPGGMVDPGETPLEAARRELLEESGYASDRWTQIGSVEPNPAIQPNRCHTFLAEQARRVAEPSPQGNEEFELELRPVGEAHGLVREGQIRHALVICAFNAYALHVGQLK